MVTICARSLVLSTFLSMIALPLGAQSLVSGSITGVVRDGTGAVLPGVTVEATSPALIERVRSVVSDANGQFKIVDLRPGTYAVTFSLTGFSSFRREGIELTAGFTATVNADLKLSSIEETVTVTGASPIVDVQTVSQNRVLSRDVLDSVPTGGKTIQAFASLIVGATIPPSFQDVGGSAGEAAVNLAIHGGRPGEQRLMQDGLRINSLTGGGNSRMLLINQVSTQEVAFQMGSNSAEWSTGGVQVNVVPKEGSNALRLSSIVSYTNSGFEAENISPELEARGLSPTSKIATKQIWDYGVGLGGPVKRDRLWFYTGHRWWGAQQYQPGTYYDKTQGSFTYTPDLSRPAYSDVSSQDNNVRLTWQVTPKDKVTFYITSQDDCTCYYSVGSPPANAGRVRTPEATVMHRFYGPNYMAQSSWTRPATNRLLFEAGFLLINQAVYKNMAPGVTARDIALVESTTNVSYNTKGDAITGSAYGITKTYQTNQRVSASYVTGTHSLKTGLTVMTGKYLVESVDAAHDSVLYTLRNGAPLSITQWALPFLEKQHLSPELGLFVQDQWTVRRLTLNMGARLDYLHATAPALEIAPGRFVPARSFQAVDNLPKWTDMSARFGAGYDLFGTGRTALKVAIGQYMGHTGTNLARDAAPSVATVNSANRTWADANRDFIPDCDLRSIAANGECGALSNTRFGQAVINRRYDPDLLEGSGVRDYNWQMSASVQHEVTGGVALGFGYFRTWYGNFTAADNLAVTPDDYDPYCVTAPVDSRLPGGGGNRLCGLYDIRPAKFGQVDSRVTLADRFGKQTERYNGFDATVSAKFGQGGLVGGGLNTGRTVTDNCFVVDSPEQMRPQFCHVSPPWSANTQVKFHALYPLPWDLSASAVIQNLPGIPVAASAVIPNADIVTSLGRNLGAGPAGTVTVELIPPNTVFEGRINQVDVRLTKALRIKTSRVSAMLDVYNLFNGNTILAMNTRFGPQWLRPLQILGPRLFKLSGQLEW